MPLEWLESAVFYQIFPDRFARSGRVNSGAVLETWESPPGLQGFKGGDLFGIVDKFDYLQELGINGIYLTPIFQSTANHRYHTCDYYQVDPLLGGNRAFMTFLEEAHRRGIRVVLDGVFNHTGRGFFPFSHVIENGVHSPYRDWFHINSFPIHPYTSRRGKHGYHAWWDMPALPKLNISNPYVREYLLQVACHWIESGIDGWRLDVPEEIREAGFWQEFRQRVKSVNSDAWLIGELWSEAGEWLKGDRFDGAMNYPLARACLGFVAGGTLNKTEIGRCAFRSVKPLTGKAFITEVKRILAHYPAEVSHRQLNLLGSHDTPRFRTMVSDDRSAYPLALMLLVMFPGVPCVYYGDETGMTGGHDPGCRSAFLWQRNKWDQSLWKTVQTILAFRQKFPSLVRGSLHFLEVFDQTIAIARILDDEAIVAFINAGDSNACYRFATEGLTFPGTRFIEVARLLRHAAILQPVDPLILETDGQRFTSVDIPPRSVILACCRRCEGHAC